MASILTMQPARSNCANRKGSAVFSFECSATCRLPQDQVARRGPGTHHLDRVPASGTLMGAARCLAINGDVLGGQDGVDRLHPREKTRLKLLWVQARKDAPKGI